MRNTEGADPSQFLTRLYNGLTTEISKAEAEINRLRNASEVLAAELQNLQATALKVSLPLSQKLMTY